jgi:hypothetical protein
MEHRLRPPAGLGSADWRYIAQLLQRADGHVQGPMALMEWAIIEHLEAMAGMCNPGFSFRRAAA